jgi:hypothetical protein
MGGVDREVRQGLKQGSLRGVGEFTIVVSEPLGASGWRCANHSVWAKEVSGLPNNRSVNLNRYTVP